MKGDGALDKEKILHLMATEKEVIEFIDSKTYEELTEILASLKEKVALPMAEKSSEIAANTDAFVIDNITEDSGLLVIATMIDHIIAASKKLRCDFPEMVMGLDKLQDIIITLEFKSKIKRAIMEWKTA